MDIYKLAKKYNKIIIKAAKTSYADLVTIHELAQDIVNTLTYKKPELYADEPEIPDATMPDVMDRAMPAAMGVAKFTAALADKAYRTGLTASELKFATDKLKSKILNYALNPDLAILKTPFGEILSKLQNLTITDIESQIPQPGVFIEPIEIGSLDEDATEQGAGLAYVDNPKRGPSKYNNQLVKQNPDYTFWKDPLSLFE